MNLHKQMHTKEIIIKNRCILPETWAGKALRCLSNIRGRSAFISLICQEDREASHGTDANRGVWEIFQGSTIRTAQSQIERSLGQLTEASPLLHLCCQFSLHGLFSWVIPNRPSCQINLALYITDIVSFLMNCFSSSFVKVSAKCINVIQLNAKNMLIKTLTSGPVKKCTGQIKIGSTIPTMPVGKQILFVQPCMCWFHCLFKFTSPL